MNRVKASLTTGIAALLAALLAGPIVADDVTEPDSRTFDFGPWEA